MSTTHELNKLAYFDALGLELLVAVRPLPGAAASAPRCILQVPPVTAAPATESTPTQPEAQMPHIEMDKVPAARTAPRAPGPAGSPAANRIREPAFHMAAVVAGGCLWLDTLPAPILPPDQLKLIQAMAHAVAGTQGQPTVTRFDWPLHGNRQLDLGPGAAAAALTSFVQRQLQQHHCRALVLLGTDSGDRLQAGELPDIATVSVPLGCAELLAQPLRKREAWLALESLCR
ncbi:hypothetical protein CWI75_12405 [Kineobactrum sediminis]|uniref:Uncharacterized protein n=1 Tax=Kineobactrum sediminis TaxID=1905677 RepID=A0A2N5Y0I4_9GAMM|nr:hypothetical protein [Kineobactrum sediminis]PLW81901.1 hypothetical protein CWI75_12405 [Kineobactrum sediminis]